jgi:spore maturation protein CgeB
MKILILDTYYQSFIDAVYASRPNLADLPYREQWRVLMDQCFGTADFYSSNLQPLGVAAEEVVVNADPLQARWAKENAPVLAVTSWASRLPRVRNSWRAAVAKEQVGAYRPDVLYVQDAMWPSQAFLEWARDSRIFLVAQHGTSLTSPEALRAYDLVISAVPSVVRACTNAGISSEYLRLGFGERVLDRFGISAPMHDVVHVGSYGSLHAERNELLEQVAESVPSMLFWGPGIQNLPSTSPIRQRYQGTAWGLDMYNIRAASRLTMTKHISSVVGEDAANQTLYEATGVGTCLVVDNKKNLSDLFERDREIVTYDSADDAIEKIIYLLGHEDERAQIAAAGQQRTLSDHTYALRMRELHDILNRHL